jgi:Na+-driven multidrug efflux pump
MAICCVALLVWAENIIRLFNTDPHLVQTGVTFLRIAVAGYLGMSIVYIMQNCISGAGDTLPPMLITLAMLWAVMMPLVFFLTRYTGLGANGVRWAIAVSFTVGAVALLLYFWRGRWKNKRV